MTLSSAPGMAILVFAPAKKPLAGFRPAWIRAPLFLATTSGASCGHGSAMCAEQLSGHTLMCADFRDQAWVLMTAFYPYAHVPTMGRRPDIAEADRSESRWAARKPTFTACVPPFNLSHSSSTTQPTVEWVRLPQGLTSSVVRLHFEQSFKPFG